MAKHTQGKKMSKGLRLSCKSQASTQPAVEPKATHVKTALRAAFEQIKVAKGIDLGALPRVVMDCLYSKAGTRPFGRGWTANLSPRTTKQLVQQGVFA